MIDTKPELAQCPRCGRYVLLAETDGCTVAVNPETVDAPRLARTVVDGRSLYDVTRNGKGEPHRLKYHRMGEPIGDSTVAEHECGSAPVYRLVKPPVVQEPTPCPKGPQAPVQGRATARSATPATRTRSEPCDNCGKPVELDTTVDYVSLELGATVVWAIHESCPVAS